MGSGIYCYTCIGRELAADFLLPEQFCSGRTVAVSAVHFLASSGWFFQPELPNSGQFCALSGQFWLVFSARTAQFCLNCAANFGSTVLARTAAMAAVLAARTGQFWILFWLPELPSSGCSSGCQKWAVLAIQCSLWVFRYARFW